MLSFSRRALRALTLVTLFVIAGCSFRPLYQQEAEQGFNGDRLTDIWVDAKKSVLDFELANQLRYAFRGGLPADEIPAYRLTFTAKSEVVQTSIERATGDPRSFTLTLSAHFKLYRLADEPKAGTKGKIDPLFQRRLKVRSSYDSTNQRFGRAAAREDALERSAKEMAHRLHRELVLFWQRNPKQREEK